MAISSHISAVAINNDRRLGIVFEPLAHLFAVAGEDQASANEVSERGRAEQMGSQHDKSVEPAAGLIDALSDKIGREAGLEGVDVLKRIVTLRSTPKMPFPEPAVQHLFDP